MQQLVSLRFLLWRFSRGVVAAFQRHWHQVLQVLPVDPAQGVDRSVLGLAVPLKVPEHRDSIPVSR